MTVFHTHLYSLLTDKQFSAMSFTFVCMKVLFFYTIGYALLEKVKKEQFVIGITNSKTKKLMIQLINQMPSPIALVSQKGQILFCNGQFEQMTQTRLGINGIPQSIFKLTSEEEGSGQRLKTLVDETIKPEKSGNLANGERKVEIRLVKTASKGASRPMPAFQRQVSTRRSPSENGRRDMEETKSNIDRSLFSQKEIFDKYEMAIVKVDQVVYNSQKAAMLTFNMVSEQRAKNQLMFIHSQVLIKFLNNFNIRLQQHFKKYKNDEQQNAESIEFIGSIYFTMNKLQQIQHQLSDLRDLNKTQEENFMLREEVLHVVESLSVKCMSQEVQIKLDQKSCLPDMLLGEIQNFRLALQTVVEFSYKYCKEGFIDFAVDFEGMTPDQKLMITFDISFAKSNLYNEEPLIKMLNNLHKNPKGTIDEVLLQNYDEVFDMICHFGTGILIFPNLIASLDGSYSFSILQNSPGVKSSRNSETNVNQGPRLKINFKIPFNHATSRKVNSPYFDFNPFKEDANGKLIVKSPMLKSRMESQMVKDNMKKIMDANKSPTPQGRALPPQPVSAFQGIYGVRKNPDQQAPISSNHLSPFNLAPIPPRAHSQVPGSTAPLSALSQLSQLAQPQKQPQNENLKFLEVKKEEPTPIRRQSDSVYGLASEQKNVSSFGKERAIVKKVENKLLDFEKRQPSHQDFFKVQKIASQAKLVGDSFKSDNSDPISVPEKAPSKQDSKTVKNDELDNMQHVPSNFSIHQVPQKQSENKNGDQIVKNELDAGIKLGSALEIIKSSSSMVNIAPLNSAAKNGTAPQKKESDKKFPDALGGAPGGLSVIQAKIPSQVRKSLFQKNVSSNAVVGGQQPYNDDELFSSHPHNDIRLVVDTPRGARPTPDVGTKKLEFSSQKRKTLIHQEIEEFKNHIAEKVSPAKEESKIAEVVNKENTVKEVQNVFAINNNANEGDMKDQSAKFGTADGLENFDAEQIFEDSERKIADVAPIIPEQVDMDLTYKTHEVMPLSKHLPNSLAHRSVGASKNLLVRSRNSSPKSSNVGHHFSIQNVRSPMNSGYDKFGKNMSPLLNNNLKTVQNEEPMRPTNITDIPRRLKPECTNEDEEESKSVEIFFPYKRGHKTFQCQQQTKKTDFDQRTTIACWNEEECRAKREALRVLNPRNQPKPGEAPKASGAQDDYINNIIGGTMIDFTKRYVLVVEDNTMISMILVGSLGNMGIKAIVADNGKIGVEKFHEFMQKGCLFEFILMDIIMPVMGGYEATTLIRQAEEQYKLAPHERHFICGFSADVSAETTKKSKVAGMSDILSKPMSQETQQKLVDGNKRDSNVICKKTLTVPNLPENSALEHVHLGNHLTLQMNADILVPSKVQAHS